MILKKNACKIGNNAGGQNLYVTTYFENVRKFSTPPNDAIIGH